MMTDSIQFTSFSELSQVVGATRDFPFDDDNVTWDPLEETLEIRFNKQQDSTITDENGIEREVYMRLLLREVEGFDIERFNLSKPYQFVRAVSMNEQTVRFVIDSAEWLVTFKSAPIGEFGEAVDDTDFELTFSMSTLGYAILGLAIVGLVVWWLF